MNEKIRNPDPINSDSDYVKSLDLIFENVVQMKTSKEGSI